MLAAGAGALAHSGPGLRRLGRGRDRTLGAGTGPQTSGGPEPVSAGNVPVSSSSDGITITTEASAFLRGGVRSRGTVPGSDAGDVVEIDQLGSPSAAASWVPVADTNASVERLVRGRDWHPNPAPAS